MITILMKNELGGRSRLRLGAPAAPTSLGVGAWLLCLALATGLAHGQDPAAPSGSSTATYTLQRGDMLEVKVFNVPNLTDTVTVRPDGRISLMLVDDLEVAGRTTAELRKVLTDRYAEFYRDPKVTINVKTFANLKVYVGGEVTTPGLLPLVGDMTVARAVIQAGGLRATARGDSVVLLRRSADGKPEMTKLDLADVLRNGKPDVPLQPFDVVFVPKSRIAKVDDWVDRYLRQAIPLTLSAGFSYILNNPFPAVAR